MISRHVEPAFSSCSQSLRLLHEYKNDQIILNVSPSAVQSLIIDNELIEFSARFNGVARDISVPMRAVIGIYARENGQGMAFPEDEEYTEYTVEGLEDEFEPSEGFEVVDGSSPDEDPDPNPPTRPSGPPNLKVVK